MANTFAQLSADVAAVGGLDYGEEQTTSDRWAKGGLRMIGRAGAWEWLRAHTSFSLTAGTYNYAFSTIASDLFRIDTRTVRVGASTYLEWGRIQNIDEFLGPDWKDAGADRETPAYVTRVGNSLWVARIPDAVATVSFYYFRSEAYDGNLYLPDELYECAIEASLAFGFTQEDDPRADSMLQRFTSVHLPEMRSARLDIGRRDRMSLPQHLRAEESALDDYSGSWIGEA